MGTVVGVVTHGRLPELARRAAIGELHEADRVFSTWNPASPMARLRAGRAGLEDLDPGDAALIVEVLRRCELARELTGGAFDPWALPGGVDPTGLVKGWAAERALRALGGGAAAMVNAGGDLVVSGTPGGRPWRVGIRHPGQPEGFLAAVVEVAAAVATSGDYERPGQLVDPATGRAARAAGSATVTGPDLDLADALATGLAVGGRTVLAAIDRLPGYDAYLVTGEGRHLATPTMAFAAPTPGRAAPERRPPATVATGRRDEPMGGDPR